MRLTALAIALALTACVAPQAPSGVSTTLISADATTSLAVGERISEEMTTIAPGGQGDDPVVNLALRHADGRTLAFQQGNHSPNDLFVQREGGALAQIMGLTGNEAPTLYHAASGEGASGAFFCGPQGPAAIGRYEAPDGTVRIVGLRQEIEVTMRPDGQMEAVPYSPSLICARLSFRKG